MCNPYDFSWETVEAKSGDITALMRAHRSDGVEILFYYGEDLYRVGVDPSRAREMFYLDAETFPSMLAFCSGAALQDGCLLLDLQVPLQVAAVNGGDPAPYFA